MSVFLTDANGNNISTFGAGTSAYAQGTPVNAAAFGAQNLFGGITANGASATTPATTSSTSAGAPSKLGFTDLTASKRGVRGRGGLKFDGPIKGGNRLLATGKKVDVGGLAGPLVRRGLGLPDQSQGVQDQESGGRSDSFGTGMAEARPAWEMPGQLSDDMAD